MATKTKPTDSTPTAFCKGCNRPIVWGVDDAGTRIPLDRIAPVYQLLGSQREGMLEVARTPRAFVSHFATCPKAGEFSGKGKKGAS